MKRHGRTRWVAGLVVTTSVLWLCAMGETVLALPFPWPDTIDGAGPVVEEHSVVSNVRGVELASVGEVVIALGDTEALRITAEENLLPWIETVMDDGVLILRTAPDIILRPTQPITFYLTVRTLEHLYLAGSGKITAPVLEADQFTATVSGHGDLEILGLYASILTVLLAGMGDVRIASGSVEAQTIAIPGIGQYKAGEVVSTEASLDVQGFGVVTVQVQKRLAVTMCGSGSVEYLGKPMVVETVTGLGRITPLGFQPTASAAPGSSMETFDTVATGSTDFRGAGGARFTGGEVLAVAHPGLAHTDDFAYRVQGTVTVTLPRPVEQIAVFVVGDNFQRISLDVEGTRRTSSMSSIGKGTFSVNGSGEDGVGGIERLTFRSSDGWIDTVIWGDRVATRCFGLPATVVGTTTSVVGLAKTA